MPSAIHLALLSMFFAGLTSVIAKMGLKNVSGDTGLAVRTIVVFALIDKASILITLLLSFWILREPFTLKIAVGAGLILSGLLVLTFWK